MTPVITIIVALLGSTGVASLVQFLISRRDTKADMLTKISADLTCLRGEIARDRAVSARIRILAASDEVLHGTEHSIEWWNQVNEDITGYNNYCEINRDFKNNKAVMAIDHLNKVYAERLDKNDFI